MYEPKNQYTNKKLLFCKKIKAAGEYIAAFLIERLTKAKLKAFSKPILLGYKHTNNY